MSPAILLALILFGQAMFPQVPGLPRTESRAAGQSNSTEHRAIRVLAMNRRCAEARSQAAATGDRPLIEWVGQTCGDPTPPPRQRKVCDMVQLWTSAEEAEAIKRCEAERENEGRD